ncbi:MAG TPA: 50S ribosomal protein L31e [Thermoproteales archaeon]|nr:50S ribosomal protein L31e [Thermoproteales archaeon]
MATKEKEEKSVSVVVIPLRKAYYVPRPKRANKAVKLVREYVQRHFKVDEVKISNDLNEFIWSRNREKPPRRVKVSVRIIEEEESKIAIVSLAGETPS